jgi:hypothetical protein
MTCEKCCHIVIVDNKHVKTQSCVVVLDTQKLSRPPITAAIFTSRNLVIVRAARFIKRYKISLKKNEIDSYLVFNETSSHAGH